MTPPPGIPAEVFEDPERLALLHACRVCRARVNQACAGPRPHPDRIARAERTRERLAATPAAVDEGE